MTGPKARESEHRGAQDTGASFLACETLGVAQQSEQRIVVGGNRSVGKVSVDGGAVRGEGGPLRPQLVVPLKIEMSTAPADAMVALCFVKALISREQHPFPTNAIGSAATEILLDGLPARSFPTGHPDHHVELRFLLSAAEINALEDFRLSGQSAVMRLYVGLDGIVAGVRTYNQLPPAPDDAELPWSHELGMVSQLFPFWNTQIRVLPIAIEQSRWVDEVLPGLGYDRQRLIELSFPPPLPEHKGAAAQFDKARRALDERRYDDVIRQCRALLNMWEGQLGATKDDRLASIVARDRNWIETDLRRQLLDALWKEVGDLANAAHHPEGEPEVQVFDQRDARLLLLLTAALSEYLAS
jgi:hypothetical protein